MLAKAGVPLGCATACVQWPTGAWVGVPVPYPAEPWARPTRPSGQQEKQHIATSHLIHFAREYIHALCAQCLPLAVPLAMPLTDDCLALRPRTSPARATTQLLCWFRYILLTYREATHMAQIGAECSERIARERRKAGEDFPPTIRCSQLLHNPWPSQQVSRA